MNRRLAIRIALIAGIIAIILCIGTAGFRIIEGYTVFDAFYMTLITITTVGYTEVHTLDRAGRIFNSFLIFFGVSAMFLAVGAMTQTIFELELDSSYAKRRKTKLLMKLNNHFIVCGFGRVGRSASNELLRTSVPFVIIDRNPQRVEAAVKAGMLAVVADATRDDCLREAGIQRAAGFIAALPTDAENLYVILSAKALNPRLTVVTRASEEDAEKKLQRAGADTVFSPYTMAGRRLAQALIRPHVVQFLNFAMGSEGPDIAMEQIRVAPESEFATRTVGELVNRFPSGLAVLALRKPDGAMTFNPPAGTRISSGDYLIVMGKPPDLQSLELVATNASGSK